MEKLCYCGKGKSGSLPRRPSKDAQRSAVFGDRASFPLIFVSWRTLWMVFNYKNIDTVYIQSEIRDRSVFLTGSTAMFLNPAGQTSWLTDNILPSRRKIIGFPCGIYIMMVGWTSKLKPVEEIMETTIHWQAQRIFPRKLNTHWRTGIADLGVKLIGQEWLPPPIRSQW